MAITETDIESGEEEGNMSQKEQEEELQKAKKKQVLFLLSVMCMRWKSFLNMDIGISAIYFGSKSALTVLLVTLKWEEVDIQSSDAKGPLKLFQIT